MTLKPTYEELEQKVKLLEEQLAKGKQVEESLHDTEKLYHLLFDHSPDGVVIVDPATARFLDFNETTCLMLGYTREEFSKLSIFDLEANQTPEEIRLHIEYVIKHGISDFETRQRTKQGKIINLHVTAQSTEVLGKPVYHCIWRDITDRKQAEHDLLREMNQLQTILNLYHRADTRIQDIEAGIIEECVRISESRLGFFGLINEDETVMMAHLWSEQAMEGCAIDFKPVEFPIDHAGIWAEAIRKHETLIVNDYLEPDPRKKGYPEGHVPIKNLMSIPIIKGGKAVAIMAVANKKLDYNETDVLHLSLFLESVWDILKRVKAEEELRKTLNLLNSIGESSTDAIYVKDIQGRYLLFNKEAAKVTGKKPEEVIGKDDYFLFPADEAKAVMDGDRRVLESGQVMTFEEVVTTTGGTVTYLSTKGPLCDSEGKVFGLFGIARDITKYKQMEAALKESERRLADIIDFLPDATFAIDLSGKVIAWNRAIEEMTGVKAEDILGKGNHEYAVAFYGMQRPMLIDKAIGAAETDDGKYDFVKRKGNLLLAEGDVILKGVTHFIGGKAGPLYDSHGNIVGAIESVRDITERKLMEAALKESERRLADIIDFLPDATFAIDLSGEVIAWNRAIEEMTGVKAEDILGKGNYEYALPFYGIRRRILIDLAFEFNEEIEKKYDFVRRQGNVLLAETNVTLRGEPRTLWGKARPLYDSRGNVAGTIESVRDITELRQAREALQKSHDELEIRVRERTVELMQANKALEAEISERKRAEEKILILANLSDISPLSITVYDLQDNLLYANQRTFDMHGYSKKEFLARNLHEIDTPSSAAWIEERKKEVLATGGARFIVEHYRKDGTCFPLEVYLKATKWRGKTVLLSVAADITERMRIEEELRKYREDLEVLVLERTSELEEKTNNLQEINTTLNVLLQKREEDKKIMEENFVANIGSLVLPYLEKIRKYNLDEQQQYCLDTIEKNLDEIATPLLKNIQQFNLTPREIQIASLINDGKTTKEIAQALGIAEGSIATHRKNIRKKLGLDRSSSLQSHLRFFEK